MYKFFCYIICLLLSYSHIDAQILEPVKWKFSLNANSEIVFEAKLDKGWHLYDLNLPEGGPVSTVFNFETVKGAELTGPVATNSSVVKKFDKLFEMELRWYENTAVFVQKIKVTNPANFEISGNVTYMACNDKSCLPPTSEEFQFTGETIASSLTPSNNEQQTIVEKPVLELQEYNPGETIVHDLELLEVPGPIVDANLWTSVIDELRAYGITNTGNSSWWAILLAGFIGGFIALLTPCVWPMIPMTVSFFLKRSKANRKKAIANAFVYGVSIIVIYLVFGLLITIFFGASAQIGRAHV